MVVGIGDNRSRKDIVTRLAKVGIRFGTAIHPSAVIARDVRIGEGSVVMAQGVLNPGCRVDRHCIINTAASADHHNRIGDYVHISPGARLGGGVSVGDGAWIGIGSTVLDNLRVGSGAIVGGGAVVIRNVKPGMIVVGVPAGNLHKSPDPWAPASRKKKK